MQIILIMKNILRMILPPWLCHIAYDWLEEDL